MKRTLIIAEAGVNHNGNIDIAKKLIETAAKVGADVIKFQTFDTDSLLSKNTAKANYQLVNTKSNESQKDMLKKLSLNEEEHKILLKHCKDYKIEFLSTAFDIPSLKFLETLNLKRIKIPSGEITNLPYLKKISKYDLPIILSTGMANMKEIKEAIKVLDNKKQIKKRLTIMHCTSEYPAPYEDVNLRAINTIKNIFSVNVGYSDHTLGIEIAVAAVAMGASIIEKHITLDKEMQGPDHKASIEPEEFERMVKGIRKIDVAFGDGVKRPSKNEIKNIKFVRKFIVASRFIKKGEKLSEENITVKRSGEKGISPMKWDKIIGQKAKKDFYPDQNIQ